MKNWREIGKLKYSQDASILMDHLHEDIDIQKLEKFVEDHLYIVGDGYILMYLQYQKKVLNKG